MELNMLLWSVQETLSSLMGSGLNMQGIIISMRTSRPYLLLLSINVWRW